MTLSTSSCIQDDLIGQHYGKLTVIAPATFPHPGDTPDECPYIGGVVR